MSTSLVSNGEYGILEDKSASRISNDGHLGSIVDIVCTIVVVGAIAAGVVVRAGVVCNIEGTVMILVYWCLSCAYIIPSIPGLY